MKGKNVSTNHGSSFAKGKNPFPNNVNTSAIRSDSKAKDDKNWSISDLHAKMRAEAHSKNADHSNLPLQGVPGGDNLKGGK